MFKRENLIEDKLEKECVFLLELMDKTTAWTDDYESMANQLAALMELRQKERSSNRVSMDTWVTVGTHLAGILMVMNHERAHVIASKAFGFIKKIV